METVAFLIQQPERCHIDDLIRLRSYLLEQSSSASYVCRGQEERHIWREQYRRWLYDLLESDEGIRIFIAVAGQKVIGCSTGIIDRRAPSRDCMSGYSGWIQSVVVDPSFRRQRVAASLLQSLTEWFSERNVSKILLESTPGSEKFYIAQGFVSQKEALFIRGI